MNVGPRVSTILPFLNAEAFLQEAIDSVVAQSYPNWDLVLVDDGSTDRSSEIAQRAALNDPRRISYHDHPGHANLGTSASRNRGLQWTTGSLIAYLDADDLWLPHKLREQVALLESLPEVGMLYGRSEYWFGWTGRVEDRRRDFVQRLGVEPNTVMTPPGLLSRLLTKEVPAPCPSDVLIRRDVIDRIGGFEDQFTGMFDDQVLYAKLCLHTSIFVADRCWDKYRQHSDSCVARSKRAGQYHTARQFYLRWLDAYLQAEGYAGTDLWRVLQQQLWRYRHPTLFALSEPIKLNLRKTQDLAGSIVRRLHAVGGRH